MIGAGPEAAAAAHRDEPERAVGALELVQRGRDEPGAGRADRVAERDRAAVRVDLSMSGFSSRSHASTTDANASLISTVSKSAIASPVRSSRRRVASIGPVSISTGSTPTRHWSTMRARGRQPELLRPSPWS